MQQATCPECNLAIGGANHTLTSGNTHASEFEELARRHTGAERSPWPWGN